LDINGANAAATCLQSKITEHVQSNGTAPHVLGTCV
jgi:hypothetical protein